MSKFDISIGRSGKNDIQFDDPTISSIHATLSIENSNYYLIDESSTNGTFVDNRRIKSIHLDESSEILFGSFDISSKELIDRGLTIVNKNKIDFSTEYSLILRMFKQYQSKKDKIQSQSPGALIFRLLTSSVIVILLIMFPDLISNSIRYPLIIMVGLLPLVYNYFFNSRSKKQEMIAMLDLEYEERLRCPKCGFRMISYNYTYWQGRSECLNPKCTAVFKN